MCVHALLKKNVAATCACIHTHTHTHTHTLHACTCTRASTTCNTKTRHRHCSLSTQYMNQQIMAPFLASYEVEKASGVAPSHDEFQHNVKRSIPKGHTFKVSHPPSTPPTRPRRERALSLSLFLSLSLSLSSSPCSRVTSMCACDCGSNGADLAVSLDLGAR